MIFNWFNAKEETAFGHDLATHLDSELKSLEKKSNKKQDESRRKLIARIMQRARQFGETRKLNTFKKAKLGNAFKWKLEELGYDREFIDSMTKEVLLTLR